MDCRLSAAWLIWLLCLSLPAWAVAPVMITANADNRAPVIYEPGVTVTESTLASTHDGIGIMGTALGARDKGTVIWVNNGSVTTQIYGDDAQALGVFEDGIYLDWTSTATSKAAGGWVQVRTPRGITSQVNLTDYYSYTAVELPSVGGEEAALPIQTRAASDGTIYANAEYVASFFWKVTSGGSASTISITRAPDPGPYALVLLGYDARTHTSALVEQTMIDPSGNVWTAWGGGHLYTGALPNHSRIIRFNPSTSAVDCYNVPGNQNQIVGLVWNTTDSRVYFGGANLGDSILPYSNPNAIWSFDPSGITPNCSFDFSTSLQGDICAGAAASNCWKVWTLPPMAGGIAQLTIYNDIVYAALRWDGRPAGHKSNATFPPFSSVAGDWAGIAMLDPATSEIKFLKPGKARQPFVFGQSPWNIEFNSSRMIWSNAADMSVGYMDDPWVAHPNCLTTNGTYDNGCVRAVTLPTSYTYQTSISQQRGEESLHTIALAPSGKVWFATTQVNFLYEQTHSKSTVGYIPSDESRAIRLAPLCIPHQVCATVMLFVAGIDVDASTTPDDAVFLVSKRPPGDYTTYLGRIHEQP